MSRPLKLFLYVLATLLALLILCVVLLTTFDWNRAKPWLNARVSNAAGRPFAINGDLGLQWAKASDPQNGWQRWIPWPRLSASDVTLGNPDWVKTAPQMLTLGQITFSISPLALLGHKILIPSMTLKQPDILLERARDGRNNWTFKQDQEPSKWKLDLREFIIDSGKVHLIDAAKRADVEAQINTLPAGDGKFGIGWQLSGSFNGAPVSGKGKAGAVLALQNEREPFPVQADVKVGKTAIAVNGTISDPKKLAAVDMRMKVSGASMAHLYPLTGIVLPDTPPFATEGHMVGRLDPQGGEWRYENFSGRVGTSDLSGSLAYLARKPRPLLRGELVSKLLSFTDLAPLIGADSNASKVQRQAPAVQPNAKALPVEEFKTERWTSIDADVKFTGRKIVRTEDLPITDLTTHLTLDNGVLTLNPLNFGVAGGNLVSNLQLDGRSNPLKAKIDMSARHFKLKQLFPKFESLQGSVGEINGDAKVSATGNSVAALLASSNGEVKALVNQGTISKLLLEEVGLNVGNIVLTKLFGDKQVQLNCLASDFVATNGVLQARTFLIDTADAEIAVTGDINLRDETMNLVIRPETKQLRMLSLRTPLYVGGTFKQPKVGVDKGLLALKAGSAIALGVLTPVAALLPLITPGPDKENQCGKLLAQAKIAPVAPAPGKTLITTKKPPQR